MSLGGLFQGGASLVQGEAEVAKARYQSTVARRQATFNRLNAEIVRDNRKRLLTSFGDQAQQVGEEAAGIIADNELDRSASGFSFNSAAFDIQRNANRSRLLDNLERLGRGYSAEDESLVNQAYSFEVQADTLDFEAEFLTSQIPLIRAGAALSAIGSVLGSGGGGGNALSFA